MIVKRIKPQQIPRPSRAKQLIIYATGKTQIEQIRLLAAELKTVQGYVAGLDPRHSPGEAAEALRYAQILSETLEALRTSPKPSIDRGSALASYALRLSDRNGATWAVIDGVAGWCTGEAFYSGVTAPHTAEREFASFASKSKRGGHPIDHLLFSWPKDERPTLEQMLYAANSALSGSGVPRDCPRVLAIHDDTDNLHVHVVLSRYRPALDKVWSCGRWLDKLHRATRNVEIAMGFSHDNGNSVVVEEAGEKIVVERAYRSALLSAGAASTERRLGVPSFERFIRNNRHDIERLAESASDWQQLHHELAMNYGIGLKRHGAGLVINDLSHAKGASIKASLGGLGAPFLEARLGPWRQLDSPISQLRKSASKAQLSYAYSIKDTPSPCAQLSSLQAHVATERRNRQRAAKERDEAIRLRRAELIRESYDQVIASSSSTARREAIAHMAASLREMEEQERAARANNQRRIKNTYALRHRTPLALGEPTILPIQAGIAAVAIIGLSSPMTLKLPGYEIVHLEDRVEYLRGGSPVLIDDGETVRVLSEVSADIEDAIRVLVSRDPDAAARGITITGDDSFREQAMYVVHRLGLRLANQDIRMQLFFDELGRSPLPGHSPTISMRFV